MQPHASWGAREQGKGVLAASSPPTPAIQSPPPQEAVRTRDKKRVNKLFSKTGRLLHPPEPPFHPQPPPCAGKGQMGGGIDQSPEPGPRPRRSRADQLTTQPRSPARRRPMGALRAAVAGQRGPGRRGGAGTVMERRLPRSIRRPRACAARGRLGCCSRRPVVIDRRGQRSLISWEKGLREGLGCPHHPPPPPILLPSII